MGMFTSIVHPEDGRELQIKSGTDDCETYEVGATVNWFLGTYPFTGKLLDGVYSSYSNLGEDGWVVIKDHVVAAVEPRERPYADIYAEYDIQEPTRDMWGAEALERYDAHQKELETRWADFEKRCEGKSPQERMAMAIAESLKSRMSYSSLAREIFKVEPMPEGANAIYLKEP